MKPILLIIFLNAFIAVCTAQKDDTSVIYVSDNKNTTLVFEDDIERGIAGASNYSFNFDKAVAGPIGLIKGTNGPDSNLLVVTSNGNMYNFTLKYKRSLDKTYFFIKDTMAVGNTNGEIVHRAEQERLAKIQKEEEAKRLNEGRPVTINGYDTETETIVYDSEEKKKEDILYNQDKIEYIRKFCSNETSKDLFFKSKYASSGGVYFQLKNLVYNKNELYFTMIIDNTTNLDYDVRDVEFYMVSKQRSKSTSTQKIILKPMYIFDQPKRVEGKHQQTFVYVFDKFSVGPKKSLDIELLENKGERNIILALDVNTINNPN